MYDSIEGKEVKSTIIWRDVACGSPLVIAAILDPANAWQSETLKSPTKYCRVIRRQIRGRCRWYVQLVDIGPSNIAAVGQTDAIFEQFCPSIVQPWKGLRRIERAMDRSK
jgi:putative transposase